MGNIIIKITNESISDIFSKKIITESGEEKTLVINVGAEDDEDRQSTLFTETAIVVSVSSDIHDIIVGDTAIISYELIHDKSKMILSSDEGIFFVINPTTKYHKEESMAFPNIKTPAFQLVWEKGEVDELSPLIGVIRNGELIANSPYVFVSDVSDNGIMENEELIEATVFSHSDLSKDIYGMSIGERVVLRDLDTFEISIQGKKIVCCNDVDLLLTT